MTTIIAAFVIGGLFNYCGVQANPQRIGPILAGIGLFTYSSAAYAFFIAGNHYKAFKQHIKYRSIFTRRRKSRGYDKYGFKEFSEVMDYGEPKPDP